MIQRQILLLNYFQEMLHILIVLHLRCPSYSNIIQVCKRVLQSMLLDDSINHSLENCNSIRHTKWYPRKLIELTICFEGCSLFIFLFNGNLMVGTFKIEGWKIFILCKGIHLISNLWERISIRGSMNIHRVTVVNAHTLFMAIALIFGNDNLSTPRWFAWLYHFFL